VSQVNLLPQEILERQKTRRTTALVAVAGLLLLLVIVAFYLVQAGKLGSVKDQIAAQDAVNQQIQQKIGKLQHYAELQTEAQQQQQLLDSAWAGEVSFSGLLMDVSRVIPNDMALTSMSITLTPPAATSTTTTPGATTFVGSITMDGPALNPQTVSQWLTRLESVKGWVNPWNTSSTLPDLGQPYTTDTSVDLTTDVVTARGSKGT
jgi:Tfp pilus assembly protein PilN